MNATVFQRALTRYLMWMWVPFGLLFVLLGLNGMLGRDVLGSLNQPILGLPLVSANGTQNASGFSGLGIISVGGLAVGALAFGGGALGLLAVGGGAVGVIAIGGGAVGVIAVGGGAAGLIAVGGGAAGYYALGGGCRGKHVLSYRRRDPQAIQFFCQHLPGLREAFEVNDTAPPPPPAGAVPPRA